MGQTCQRGRLIGWKAALRNPVEGSFGTGVVRKPVSDIAIPGQPPLPGLKMCAGAGESVHK